MGERTPEQHAAHQRQIQIREAKRARDASARIVWLDKPKWIGGLKVVGVSTDASPKTQAEFC